jgi:hypothetical protein
VTDGNNHDAPRASAPGSALLEHVLGRARELVESKPAGAYPLPWCVEAQHVGDISVLALDPKVRATASPDQAVNSS